MRARADRLARAQRTELRWFPAVQPFNQLTFTNLSGFGFTALGGTNLALALTNWTVLGSAVESPAGSGSYQFTDTQAPTNAIRYYRVRSP